MPHGYAGQSKPRDKHQSTVKTFPARHSAVKVVELDAVRRRAVDRNDVPPVELKPKVAYLTFKRAFDIVGASLCIVVLSPLILVIVAASFTSGGAPFFKHRRVGQYGVHFDCLKFRTMVRNANEVLQKLLDSDPRIKEEWLRDHKLRDDPRITRFGRFLRRASLDELPQLWNVLLGEMSLVGPRPVVPDELQRYGSRVSTFLFARPGITGLWQVSGRNNTSYRRRVALDVCYVRAQSLRLDFVVLLKTLPAILAKNGAY